MDCRLDTLQWDNYGRTIEGPDGNLLAEYKMMENYLLDTSLSNSFDSYTCAVAHQAFLECLDIASARTLSGSYGNETIFDANSEQNVLEQVATQLALALPHTNPDPNPDPCPKRMHNSKTHLNLDPNPHVLEQAATQLAADRSLLGRLGEQIDIRSSNYFGAEAPCMAAGSGGGKNYGDGVINAYDIAAILWVQFGHAPYGALSRNFREIATVAGRDDTRWRCGRGEKKPMWMQQLGNDYCAAPSVGETGTPITYARRMAELPAEMAELPWEMAELAGGDGISGPQLPAEVASQPMGLGGEPTPHPHHHPHPHPHSGPHPQPRPRFARERRRLGVDDPAAQPEAMATMDVEVVEWALVAGAGRSDRVRIRATVRVTVTPPQPQPQPQPPPHRRPSPSPSPTPTPTQGSRWRQAQKGHKG